MPPYLYTWRVKIEETTKNSGSHQPVRCDAVLSKRPSEIALISCAWGSAPASVVLIYKRPAPGEVRGGEAGKKWRTRKWYKGAAVSPGERNTAREIGVEEDNDTNKKAN